MHLIAYFVIDHHAITRKFLLNDETDLKDDYNWTPLLLAAENGHDGIVELSWDSNGWTTLSVGGEWPRFICEPSSRYGKGQCRLKGL